MPENPLSSYKKINLLDQSYSDLEAWFSSLGEPRFRALQLWKWMHQTISSDFCAMTNFSKQLRTHLEDVAEIRLPEIAMDHPSVDGTRKWLLRLEDGQCIEMVYIPEDGRGTLCVSSQVGCALDCTFCSTARQGFNRNLAVYEIIGQLWLANSILEKRSGGRNAVTNVVFMGMGEPLLNVKNVTEAIKIMLDDNAYGLSKRRVTLSTSGVVPALEQMVKEVDVALAVSLHAPDNATRNKLVPLNRKYPIEMLLQACKTWLKGKSHRERITFEYVMLAGVNDSLEQAGELGRLLSQIPSKVNLIPFNTFPGIEYKCSSKAQIDRFREELIKMDINTITRKTRGDDIDAACGQLAGQFQDKSRRESHFTKLEGTSGN